MDVRMWTSVEIAACVAVVVAAMADPSGMVSESAAVRATTPELRRGGVGHTVSGHTALGHAALRHAGLRRGGAGHTVSGHAALGHAAVGYTAVGHTAVGHAAVGYTALGHAGLGHTAVGYTALGHTAVGYAGAGLAGAGHFVAEHAMVGHAVGNVGVVLAAGDADHAHDADAADAGEASWVWPTGSRVVVRPWEAPADDYSAGHRGIDVPAPIGTPVVAVADGTVSFAGPVAGRSVVSIDHGGGLISTVDSVSPEVSAGDTVAQGEVVGRVAVGHCPAADPCVHLGARLDDRYVDPTPYLPAAAWPVLLPESAWPG